MAADPWEFGSLIHWFSEPCTEPARWPGGADRRWVGSGRDALKLVVQSSGADRVWLPSYLCQEMVESLAQLGPELELRCFPDSPLQAAPDFDGLGLRAGDAVVLVNYFGMRRRSDIAWPTGVVRIEDHTHAPCSSWAYDSGADYCVASLRKILPLPDGGLAWAPSGAPLLATPEVHQELLSASGSKLAGMLLKGEYLRGQPVSKGAFRALLQAGEEQLGYATPSAISPTSAELLHTLPVQAWRLRRLENFRRLAEALADGPFSILLPRDENEAPFCLPMLFDGPAARDAALAALVSRRVYPSTLWPLDPPRLVGIPAADVGLSRRLLCLPCDARFDEAAILRVEGVFVDLGLARRGG